jgi:uncharacterized protein YdaU (DUF1376 family)
VPWLHDDNEFSTLQVLDLATSSEATIVQSTTLPPLHFDVERYLLDTAGLTLTEHGAYCMMLMQQWRLGALPLDRHALYQCVHATTRAEQNTVRRVLAQYFTQTEAGYVNRRMVREIKASVRRRAASRNAAATRWNAAPLTHADALHPHSLKNEQRALHIERARARVQPQDPFFKPPTPLEKTAVRLPRRAPVTSDELERVAKALGTEAYPGESEPAFGDRVRKLWRTARARRKRHA